MAHWYSAKTGDAISIRIIGANYEVSMKERYKGESVCELLFRRYYDLKEYVVEYESFLTNNRKVLNSKIKSITALHPVTADNCSFSVRT